MSKTIVPVHLVSYDNPENMEQDPDTGEIINHDELEKTDVVRGLPKSEAREYNMDIIHSDSPIWRDEFEDIEVSDEYEV